jgi:outer membrane phospholipase A
MNAVRNDFLFHFPLLTAPSLVFSSSIELGSSYKITEENSCLSDFDEFILITRSPRTVNTRKEEREITLSTAIITHRNLSTATSSLVFSFTSSSL